MKHLTKFLLLFSALLLLPMCKKKEVDVPVSGAVIFSVGTCNLEAPNEVVVTVEAWNSQSQEKVTDSKTITLDPPDQASQAGSFDFTLKWPGDKDEPDLWKVVQVTRANGDPLCAPGACPQNPPQECKDKVANTQQEATDKLIDWRTECECTTL